MVFMISRTINAWAATSLNDVLQQIIIQMIIALTQAWLHGGTYAFPFRENAVFRENISTTKNFNVLVHQNC